MNLKNPAIFIHGQESSSRGTKGLFFKEHFPGIIIPDFTGEVSVRMSKLNEILAGQKDLTVIGSSLGGLMASLYTFQNPDNIKKLVLLAPAINLPEFTPYLSERFDNPVWIYHGKHDELIPPEPIREIGENVFSNMTFTLLDDDHRLSKTFTSIEWEKLITE